MSTDNVVRHVLDDGTIEYRNAAGELHRTDGPAVVHPDDTEEWYRNGECHREDGPAVVYPDGSEEWYLNGDLHRTDGPAIVQSNGTKRWYLNGELHREGDKPAIINADGSQSWWVNGECHREDGPAVVYPDGSEEWYRNGELHRNDGPAVVHHDDTEAWYQNGYPHREDGPAVVQANGNCEYWIDGAFIVGKTIGGVYCLERDSDRTHRPRLSTELIERVMSDKGFGSVEDFVSWLAFVVLGEEAVPVFARVREDGTPVLPVLDDYLQNHTNYEGLPFSWWYPIVEGAVNQ